MPISKRRALSIVFSAADAYGENLANRSVLFLSIDKHGHIRCVETMFDESNFNHLTGLKTNLAPRQFFNKCVGRRLAEGDFWLSPDGTTELKLKALPHVVKEDLSARMIGEYNRSRPKLYADVLAGGVHACMGFKRDEKSGAYVPNTLLSEDVRKLTSGRSEKIISTCRKCRDENLYSEVVYSAQGECWNKVKIPEELEYLKKLI